MRWAYKHLRATTTLGQNSFWHRTIPDWNSLPAAAIESKTVAAFKSQLVDLVHKPFSPSSLILQIGGAAGVPIQISKYNKIIRHNNRAYTVHIEWNIIPCRMMHCRVIQAGSDNAFKNRLAVTPLCNCTHNISNLLRGMFSIWEYIPDNSGVG